MTLFLWTLQAILALLYAAGGYYKAFQFEDLAKQYNDIPHGGWRALGVVEMIGAVLLIMPAATNWMPILTPITAVVLAIETLVISVVYARESLKLTAANPLVWSLVMLILVAFVAYGRFTILPLA